MCPHERGCIGGGGKKKNDCIEFMCFRIKVVSAAFISFKKYYFLKWGGLSKHLKKKKSNILTTSDMKSYCKR